MKGSEMHLNQKVPLFELDVRELTSGRLQLILPNMKIDDWLLVHQEGRGYCALTYSEVTSLASQVKEGRSFTLQKIDPIVSRNYSYGELEQELDRRSPDRRRLLFTGVHPVQVVFETTMAGGGAMDIGIFRPGGEAVATSSCPRLSPIDRPTGQPWLERDHDFSATSIGAYWICGVCGDTCNHPPEQRCPVAAGTESCGRCGAPDLTP